MLMAGGIEPASVTDSDGIDDQLVSLVMADRISIPSRIQVLRMVPSVGKDPPEIVIDFEEHHGHSGGLYKLERKWRMERASWACGLAETMRIVAAQMGLILLLAERRERQRPAKG